MKLNDYITGEEINSIIEDAENPVPVIHKQCDGRTNNVTFKTDHPDDWKKTILTYFGYKSELIADGGNPSVVKVTFNDDSGNTFSSKVNIYRTGSIVIQGSKCTFF